VQFKEVLKLVGAGLTGVYLALQIRKPRRPFDEFLQIYGAISIEFRHQLETVLLQTLLPAVSEQDRDALCRLLDRQSSFLDQMRFFSLHLNNFPGLIRQGLDRIYRLRAEGLVAPTARRRLACDPETFRLAVAEVFFDLERSFLTALRAHLPAERRASLNWEGRPLPELLEELEAVSGLSPETLVEAIVLFEEAVARPDLGRR
jgi:hypothetical protein